MIEKLTSAHSQLVEDEQKWPSRSEISGEAKKFSSSGKGRAQEQRTFRASTGSSMKEVSPFPERPFAFLASSHARYCLRISTVPPSPSICSWTRLDRSATLQHTQATVLTFDEMPFPEIDVELLLLDDLGDELEVITLCLDHPDSFLGRAACSMRIGLQQLVEAVVGRWLRRARSAKEARNKPERDERTPTLEQG